MIRHPVLALSIVLAALSYLQPWLVSATEIPPDWLVENHRQTLSTDGADRVVIRNPHGDLRVRPTDQSEITYSAMLQRHADDPRQAEIRGTAEKSRFRLEVVYPESKDLGSGEVPDEWTKRRVDLTIFVPAKSALDLVTTSGLIEAKGIDRRVTARSQNGDIVLASARAVSAVTEQGSITVRFTSTTWSQAAELETLTGPISVTLPQSAHTSVTMESSGEMTTDFTLTIERPEGGSRKIGRAVIGKGASELLITSRRGTLKLLRSPF